MKGAMHNYPSTHKYWQYHKMTCDMHGDKYDKDTKNNANRSVAWNDNLTRYINSL